MVSGGVKPVRRNAKGQNLPAAISVSKPLRARFIKMLRLHGVASHAAIEVGVSIPSLYRARAKFGDFAAAWDAALGEAPERAPPAGEEWGAKTRQLFLNELTITASPVRAAQRVKRSLQGALRLRGRSSTFAKHWDAAMMRAVQLLEAEVYARVLSGVRAGARPGSKTNPDGAASVAHSDRLTMFVLRAVMPETYDRPRGSTAMKRIGTTMSRAEMIAHLKQIAARMAITDPPGDDPAGHDRRCPAPNEPR